MKIKKILLIFILVFGALFIIGSLIQSNPTNDQVSNIASIANEAPENQNAGAQIQNGSRVNENPNKQNTEHKILVNQNAKIAENPTEITKESKNKNDSEKNQTTNKQNTRNTAPAKKAENAEDSVEDFKPVTIVESVTNQSIDNSINYVESMVNQTIQNQKEENKTSTDVENTGQTPTLSPENPEVKSEFDHIAATPYDEKSYNCLNKSHDFQNYLLHHGATDVRLVRVKHSSGEYMHMFVVWNGQAYDPTNLIQCYGVDYNRYIDALKEEGFTTVVD